MQDKRNTQCFLDAMHSSHMHLEEMEIVLRAILSSYFNLGCLFAVFYFY